MKIRKLILKAKLQQIERDYQYFFLYHCSGLKSAQWRQLKDLLYKTQAKSFFQPISHQKEILRNLTLDKTSSSNQTTKLAEGNVLALATQLPSEATSKKGSSHQSQIEFIGKKNKNILRQTKVTNVVGQDNSILRSLSGPFCIFYLTSRNDIQNQTSQNINSWREVLKIIDSLTSSGNFILLSGQMQSTIVNHIDIKEALNLETQSVYQQFLSSIEYPLQNLNFCIDQNRIQVVSQLENLGREKTNDNELS